MSLESGLDTFSFRSRLGRYWKLRGGYWFHMHRNLNWHPRTAYIELSQLSLDHI